MISKTLDFMIDSYQVTAAETIRQGMTCTVTSGKALETTSTDAWGIALDAAAAANPKRDYVRIHRFGAGIVPVLCSAGLNAGQTVQPAADGVAAITVGGSTTLGQCIGRLVEAGLTAGLAGCDVGNLTHTMS